MKVVNKLSVVYHNRTVGHLRMTPDNRSCVFQYDAEWLANGFSISPLELPLKSDMFIAKPEPFYGNFGVFEDSLPDGYGRYLLHRILKKQRVNDFDFTPLQRLSIVGNSGMGALCYLPESYVGEEKYFASKRFDLNDNSERLHIATAGALLNESILLPKMDYRTLLHLTGYLTQSDTQVVQMYRRMIFNILTANKDDHAKNFSFICRDGAWELAPAYDLTLCSNGYHGQHATSANNNGNPNRNDVLVVGQSIKITKSHCNEIIDELAKGCESIMQPNNIIK